MNEDQKKALREKDEEKGQVYATARDLANQINQRAREKGIPRGQFILDLMGILRTYNFTDDEIEQLYKTLRNRVRVTTCYKCVTLKPRLDGEMVWPDGDMSKPKRFICSECKGK